MKGNPILGTGSGSIGDVTIMRRNGSQVTRVRLRKIKNPMSQGQAEQRMYMAPILKFYSPLAGVLETSFEGLNKADSYAKFISVNANLARANGWAVKKGAGFTPLPYQVAGGSLPAATIGTSNAEDAALEFKFENDGQTWGSQQWGMMSSLIMAEYNLQAGDQLTFIWTNEKNEVHYTRAFLDPTSTATAGSVLIGFGCTPVGIYPKGNVCLAVIFSRWNATSQKWSRSNAFMACDETYLADYTGDENLKAAIASYMKSAGQTPVSDVYLNGSDE